MKFNHIYASEKCEDPHKCRMPALFPWHYWESGGPEYEEHKFDNVTYQVHGVLISLMRFIVEKEIASDNNKKTDAIYMNKMFSIKTAEDLKEMGDHEYAEVKKILKEKAPYVLDFEKYSSEHPRFVIALKIEQEAFEKYADIADLFLKSFELKRIFG